MKNMDKINLVLEDLGAWLDNYNDCDDSLAYAYRNNYRLHAASLWLSTGAASEDILEKIKGITINRKKELKEINAICNEAAIFICPDCNHHAFLDYSDENEIDCMSCLKTAYLKIKGEV